MSQSNDDSTLRNLRQEHTQLVNALKAKGDVHATIDALPSTNKARNIAWLQKAIKGLRSQLSKKTTKKTAPKSHSGRNKGKWTKKRAEAFVNSFENNYDPDVMKNIKSLRKQKSRKAKTEVAKYDKNKILYDWLIKEFDV